MFNNVIILGSGALTYIIVKKCCGYTADKFYDAIIEYILYIMLDFVTTFLCLIVLGRDAVIISSNGEYEMQYSASSIIFSLVVSIIWGIIISYIKKYVKVDIEITKKDK